MKNQERDPHAEADYHGDIKISGNAAMPSGSEQPNSKRDQQFVSAQQGIESSSGGGGGGGGDDRGNQPNVQPSETSGAGQSSGDPGRTPGKAEGEDDSSATESGGENKQQQQQQDDDVENYERTKEKKIAESVSVSS
jgi:hypothetical protein